MFDAALGIGAIGLRHTSAMTEARRVLSAQRSAGQAAPDDVEASGRALLGEWVGRVMDNVDESIDQALRIGRELCLIYGSSLPAGHALRFDQPENVPEDLARTAILAFDGDVLDDKIRAFTLAALPIAARAGAEDFYFPRDVLRAWFGPWTGEETLDRLTRFDKTSPKKEPVRAAPTPGRNDPCPCGSGKKWKRCCSGKGTGGAAGATA
jgi:hypothetical protein